MTDPAVRERFGRLAEVYRRGLLDDCLPFWLRHGLDRESDANNMPILCQFAAPRHRAAGYGLMNMAGVSAGALVTGLLGRSADAGRLGRDMALLAIPVVLAIALQLAVLRPKTTDKSE